MEDSNSLLVARVFRSGCGWKFCSEELDYLDERGDVYPTKAAAVRAAYASGYGYYQDGEIKRKIPERERVKCWATG